MKICYCSYIVLTAHLSAALSVQRLTQKLERRQAGGGDGATPSDAGSLMSSLLGGSQSLSGMLSGYSIASMFVTAVNFPYGKSAWSGTLPTRVEMKPTHPEIPGYKTVKIRYGPYKVPNMGVTTKTLTGNEEGMLWNYPDTNIEKPCNDCMITGIVADYEYLNGTSANIDTGQWLHHIVLLSSNSRSDPTCVNNRNSLPHWVVGFSPTSSERFWASGNERTPIRFADWNITDAGYRMAKGDILSMIVDLMNMDKQDQTIYVVITYDYFEGKPAGMSEVKPVWLDVDQCGFSEARARSQTGAYTVSSVPWKTTVNGEILGMGGHIHDGGTALRVKADGRLVCDSRASYGGNMSYISPGMSHGTAGASPKGKSGSDHSHGSPGKPHISNMSICIKGRPELKLDRMKAGQTWTVEAEYDYRQFAGATHPNGAQENVMGIGILYVRK